MVWHVVIVDSGLLLRLFTGVTASDCPLPCTTFSTETRSTSDTPGLGFAVTFQSTVEVNTKHIIFGEQQE